MIFLLLGVASLAVMMGALGMFSRAQVETVKSFGIWTLAIGGLALATLLFLTGRGAIAIAALVLSGPLVWEWMPIAKGGKGANATNMPSSRSGNMTRAEAYAVLGLRPGAAESEVRAAHQRLMRAAHPDAGGSDWLASRINQARDCLLG